MLCNNATLFQFTYMKRKLILLLLLASLTSCNKLESNLRGGWEIEKVYYHNKPVIYDLYTNRLDFNKDHTCRLPVTASALDENKLGGEKGSWEAYTKDNISYLKIKSENKIFNRTFRVLNFRKELDNIQYGYLLKMTLIADSLKMECAKVPY
jgi:hypothetical protein